MVNLKRISVVTFNRTGVVYQNRTQVVNAIGLCTFAHNFMLSVKVTNAEEFRQEVIQKRLPEKFGIRIGTVEQMPYGKEVNMIDIAGVCWHFVEQ